MSHVIDLRSDTVTRPTARMRAAMAEAEVGDDVYGDDPTVNRLQALAAERLGFEAALFTPSGTQANLVALMAHCERGDEYIVGHRAHTYRTEGGGAAVLGSIQPQPVPMHADGRLDLEAAAAAVKPDDIHYARSRVLCLENTYNGRVLPLEHLEQAGDLARRHGLALHLDGARVFNAAVALGVDVATICAPFDSVACCLSKGLGAPVGSLVCGSRDLIGRARRWRKVAGGGMRQAGVLAAAGLVALEEHVDRLADDHANARVLAEGLSALPGLSVDLDSVDSNMVFVSFEDTSPEDFARHLDRADIRVRAANPMRLVLHLDVSAADVERVLAAAARFNGG